jgi:lipopolysaccharide biosynthesis regulator YciM
MQGVLEMKRTILTGVLVLATGVSGLMAQKNKKDQPQPKEQQQSAAPKMSPGEQQALMALIQAQGKPDETIVAAENLLTKYADTTYKDTALFMEAIAYQQKGDKDKMQIFAERTLAANPKYFQASLLLADLTVQQTREHDLDRDEKLAKADKYANDAIATVTAAAKPNPQLSDQQWEEAKKDLIAQAHDALGMSALQKKNYDLAITEFKASVEGAAHAEPAFQVRLASAYQQSGKNDEAIALAEKVMNDAQTPQQIKSVAQAIRAAAVVAKNGGKPLNAPAPPPQVEVKKQ